MKKTGMLITLIVALGLTSVPLQANWLGGRHWNNQEDTEENNRYHNFIEFLCNGDEHEWVIEIHGREYTLDEIGVRLERYPRLQALWDRIQEHLEYKRQHYCERPPAGSAVPEPSTYGIIGACALLGLIAFRRFKFKPVNNSPA